MARELTRKAAVARKTQNELDPAYLADPRIPLATGLRHAVAKLERLRSENERTTFVSQMRSRIAEGAAKLVQSNRAETVLAGMNACVQALKIEHELESRALAVIPSLAEALATIEASDTDAAIYLREESAAARPRTLAQRMAEYASSLETEPT